MATITKKDLVERIVDRTSVKRHDAKKVVQEFLDLIISELKKGNRLEFRDFGVFEIKERAARVAQNPKTMQKVEVPAKRAVKFKVGRLMRDSVEMVPAPKTAAATNGTSNSTTSGTHAGITSGINGTTKPGAATVSEVKTGAPARAAATV
jgi:integration host factor subunit beta